MCRVMVVSREFDGKDRMERMAVVIYALLKGIPSQTASIRTQSRISASRKAAWQSIHIRVRRPLVLEAV